MVFCVCLSARPTRRDDRLKSLAKAKTAFFLFWVIFFRSVALLEFSTAPWNGNGLFDDSAVDLLYLKNYVIGHPFSGCLVSPFPFLHFEGDPVPLLRLGLSLVCLALNILSYEAALFFCGPEYSSSRFF